MKICDLCGDETDIVSKDYINVPTDYRNGDVDLCKKCFDEYYKEKRERKMTSQYRECSKCKSISVFVDDFKNGVYTFKCLDCNYEFLGYDKELKEELKK